MFMQTAVVDVNRKVLQVILVYDTHWNPPTFYKRQKANSPVCGWMSWSLTHGAANTAKQLVNLWLMVLTFVVLSGSKYLSRQLSVNLTRCRLAGAGVFFYISLTLYYCGSASARVRFVYSFVQGGRTDESLFSCGWCLAEVSQRRKSPFHCD